MHCREKTLAGKIILSSKSFRKLQHFTRWNFLNNSSILLSIDSITVLNPRHSIGNYYNSCLTFKASDLLDNLLLGFIFEGTGRFVHHQHAAPIIKGAGDPLALNAREANTPLGSFWLGRNAFDLQMADIRLLACVLKSDRADIAVGVQI